MVLTVSAFVLRGHPFLEKLARGRHFAASTFLTLWMLVHRSQLQCGAKNRLSHIPFSSWSPHLSEWWTFLNLRQQAYCVWKSINYSLGHSIFFQTDSFVLLKLRGFGFINRAEEVRGSGWTLSYLSHFSGNSCSLNNALDSWKDTVTELIWCI